MIAEQYQTELKNQLTRAQYLLLVLIVGALQSVKQVKLAVLAETLPIPILLESRIKKLQRFLDLDSLSIENTWFPSFKKILEDILKPGEVAYIALDRTSWSDINILMVSLIWDQRAWPIFWTLLPKKGNSNLEEQKSALSKVLSLLEDYKVVTLGDREFCSVELGKWLGEQGAYFCLRQKKNTNVAKSGEEFRELSALGLCPGMSLFLNDVNVTHKKGFGGFNVACKWKRNHKGFTSDEPWYILTNFNSLELAIEAYQNGFPLRKCLGI